MTPEEKVLSKFKSLCVGADLVIYEARKIWPNAEFYLANNTLNLMSGPHHEGAGEKARPDRIIESHKIQWIDGGDW